MPKTIDQMLGIQTKPGKKDSTASTNKQPPVKEWKTILEEMQKLIDNYGEIPDVEKFGAHMLSNTNKTKEGRFGYLVALLLSSRTKDVVTSGAMDRLNLYLPCKDLDELRKKQKNQELKLRTIGKKEKPDPLSISNLTIDNVLATPKDVLDKLVAPVGFYPTKTKNLLAIAKKLKEEYKSDVPKTYEEIVKLPGIGQKMGNLMTQLCWNDIRGISVDTHVNQIAQRLGFAGSLNQKKEPVLTPDKVSHELEEWLPKEYWAKINPLMVGFGQLICSAIAPKCSECTLHQYCKYYKASHRGESFKKDIKKEKEEIEEEKEVKEEPKEEIVNNENLPVKENNEMENLNVKKEEEDVTKIKNEN